jgi:predicted CopG family antitoxin
LQQHPSSEDPEKSRIRQSGFQDQSGDEQQKDRAAGKATPRQAKVIHMCHVYHMIMSAVKRIPVAEPVWKELSEMRSAGQTYTELLEEMMEARKKERLVLDMKRIEEEGKFVSLSEIKD